MSKAIVVVVALVVVLLGGAVAGTSLVGGAAGVSTGTEPLFTGDEGRCKLIGRMSWASIEEV